MIVVNKEHLLTVARTFMQIYNDKDAAIEQLKKDKEYGHLLEDRYNIIVNTLNKSSITIWAYKSPLSATSVVGAFRPVTSLAKDGAINTYSLVTLCCDLFDNVLKVNDLNIKDIYSSHWLTYLFEEIFTLVLPLYISSDFKYTLVQDTLTI